MKKKLAIASLILLLAPTLVFVPLYAFMVHAKNATARDYASEVVGTWEAFQYYVGPERIVCDEKDFATVTFDDGSISVKGTVLPEYEGPCSWSGSVVTAGPTGQDDGVASLHASLDSRGNLRLETGDGGLVVLLRRTEV